jgi:hypothetical protein
MEPVLREPEVCGFLWGDLSQPAYSKIKTKAAGIVLNQPLCVLGHVARQRLQCVWGQLHNGLYVFQTSIRRRQIFLTDITRICWSEGVGLKLSASVGAS